MDIKPVRAHLAKYGRTAALAVALAAAPASVQADASQAGAAPRATASPVHSSASTRIVTLGTAGGPRLRAERGESANVLQVGDRVYLVDAGPGVSHELIEAGIQAKDIDRVFITHLHFDHFGGLASLLGFVWVQDANRKIDIYGPPATAAFVDAGVRYLSNVLDLYAAQRAPTPSISEMVKTHDLDVTQPTVVYQDDKVRVTAVENSHFITLPLDRRPLGAARSYSYRFDSDDRSVVFTGDTGPSEGLEALAKGAEVLVSEVRHANQALKRSETAAAGRNANRTSVADHYEHEHLSPRQVGEIAARAGVKLVVLTHVSPGIDGETDLRRYSDGVRAVFSGTVKVARDGDEF